MKRGRGWKCLEALGMKNTGDTARRNDFNEESPKTHMLADRNVKGLKRRALFPQKQDGNYDRSPAMKNLIDQSRKTFLGDFLLAHPTSSPKNQSSLETTVVSNDATLGNISPEEIPFNNSQNKKLNEEIPSKSFKEIFSDDENNELITEAGNIIKEVAVLSNEGTLDTEKPEVVVFNNLKDKTPYEETPSKYFGGIWTEDENIEVITEAGNVSMLPEFCQLLDSCSSFGIDIENESTVSEDNQTYTPLLTHPQDGCARFLQIQDVKNNNKNTRKDLVQDKNRKWDRKNCCPFCIKLVTNFSRHILKHHQVEEEVKKYMQVLDEDKKTRKAKRVAITNELRNRGNFKYNVKVKNEKLISELIPIKRPSRNQYEVTSLTHVLCKYCFGLFKKQNLYLHQRKCASNKNAIDEKDDDAITGRKRVLKSGSIMLVADDPHASNSLKQFIYPSMVKDKISLVAQTDPLIVKFGSRFYKHHRDSYHTNYISLKMRDLARVLIAMREFNPDITYMEDCLNPKQFDNLMHVIRMLSGFNEETGECKIPSLAPRLCSTLKTCSDIVVSSLLKDQNVLTSEKRDISQMMDEFNHLMKTEWKIEISTNAEKSRKKIKVNKVDILPDSADISTVCSGICATYKVKVDNLKQNTTQLRYNDLCKDIIAHIIILSRRRPGEVVKATLQNYTTLSLNDNTAFIKESILSKEEKQSGEELHIFHVSGKNTRKVPCLLTKEMKYALDALVESRPLVGVKNNNLLFAKPDCSSLYDGSKIIDAIKGRYKLKNPKHFTATGLRHHAATYSQLSGRNDTYTENLATFMGHDLAIHKSNYKLPLALIQKAQVGHKLLQMTISKCSKKSEITSPSSSVSSANYDECTSNHSGSPKSDKEFGNLYTEEDNECFSTDTNFLPVVSDESDESSTPNKNKVRRKRWIEEEKEILYKYFGKQLILHQNPERREIKRVFELESGLKNRTFEQVCTYINNIVNNKIKIPENVVKKIKKNIKAENVKNNIN